MQNIQILNLIRISFIPNLYFSTVPDRVTGVMLMCEVMDQINQCTVQWDVSD